jgi:hypothetical protein
VSVLNLVWVKKNRVSEAGTAFPQVKHEKSETHSAQSTTMASGAEAEMDPRYPRQQAGIEVHNSFIFPDDRRRTNSQNLFSSNKTQMMEELTHTCHL